jgi:cell division protein FtsW (lipid II flippase)
MFDILYGRLFLVRVVMLLAMFGLVATGIAVIYAIGHPAEMTAGQDEWVGEFAGRWEKQVIFAVAGLLGLVLINIIDYRILGPASYWLYGITIILLAGLLLAKGLGTTFGGITPEVKGAVCWYRFGPIQLQPSEFCKITYILVLAWYLRFRSNYHSFSGLIGPFGLTILAIVLILFEPDLGTVVLVIPIMCVMLFVAGARIKHFVLIVTLAAIVSPVLWHMLEPYQRMRISCLVLQNEWVMDKAKHNDTLAEILVGHKRHLNNMERNQSYQLVQAKRAIASGGLNGFGWCRGPYIQYNYLPDRHNDFIFAIVAHQWGFWGCMGILSLYGVIIFCGIEIASSNTDPFAKLIAVGIISMFAIQVIVNIGMNVGLMPITGITLPLISYGGSSLVVNMAAIGLLQNIGRVRPYNLAGNAFTY